MRGDEGHRIDVVCGQTEPQIVCRLEINRYRDVSQVFYRAFCLAGVDGEARQTS